MKKFQFLCNNHLEWLTKNPSAALNTSLKAYSQSLALAEEYAYSQAINHAGAAYEASLIVLDYQVYASCSSVEHFTDASVLLARLLYLADEPDFSNAVLASAIARLEKILVIGSTQKTVLKSYDRLLETGGNYHAANQHSGSDKYSNFGRYELH